MPDVVLPVLNEAEGISAVLERMPAGFNPIVVDNGSTDGSAKVAERAGAKVVIEETQGFGSACRAGLEAASAEIVCFMDADASLDPRQLVRVVEPISGDGADLVWGRRRGVPGAWPIHARVANRFLAEVVGRRLGVHVRDLGPMRAARRLDLLSLELMDQRFGWPFEMVLKAGMSGWHLREVEVDYYPRIGRSKVTGTVAGTLRAGRDIARVLT
jgi:glycosyltransferase involved in cell wall biosynthesis